ncbi:MAG: M24B family metallopeptidase, partial [Flavobacteriales bacterium]
GRMATPGEVERISGAQEVRVSTESISLKVPFDQYKKVFVLRFPKGLEDDKSDAYDLFDLVKNIREEIGNQSAELDDFSLEKMVAGLREIKSKEELQLLQKAIDISVEGHLRMMDSVRAGWKEYQVESVGEYYFHHLGAEDVGYPSICGASENGCVLHYDKNRRTVTAGDLILLDMGAEYHGYTADITRTIPVSDSFTEPQRLLYELVWQAQQAGMDSCISGKDFRAPHRAALSVIEDGLIRLGIITKKEEARQYFPHSTSHYLGLDVHDPGGYGPLRPGQVITVEPGLYIPSDSDCDTKWWNIGIRIEDDILITEGVPVNMSGALPSRLDLLEKYLKSHP